MFSMLWWSRLTIYIVACAATGRLQLAYICEQQLVGTQVFLSIYILSEELHEISSP